VHRFSLNIIYVYINWLPGNLITTRLTPRSIFPFNKLVVAQLFNIAFDCCGTRRFTAVFSRAQLLVRRLGWMIQVRTLPHWFIKLRFNVIRLSTSRSSKLSLTTRLADEHFYALFLYPVSALFPVRLTLLDFLLYSTNYGAPQYVRPSPPCLYSHYLSFKLKYSLLAVCHLGPVLFCSVLQVQANTV
jgi:hypothetical protein